MMAASTTELTWGGDLARVTAKLSAAPDLNSLFHTAAFQIRQVFNTGVTIFTQTTDEPMFAPAASVGIPRDEIWPARFAFDSAVVRSLDTARHTAELDLPVEERANISLARAVLLVPVRRQKDLLGMVSLGQNPMAEPYDEGEIALLEAVASHLALCLDNFRLREQSYELQRVREIQERLLPMVPANIGSGFEIAHYWRPARAVSGDYFDAIDLGSEKRGICIADVVGKGMPAALLMSNVQAAVKAVASDSIPPSDLCARVNRVLAGNLAPGNFVTMFYSVMDTESRTLTYTNAGHCAPILIRRNGSTERLESGGALLGVFRNWVFEQQTVTLEAGDRLVLFTDGITELKDSTEEEFGEERLEALLRNCRGLNAEQMKQRVLEAIAAFNAGEYQDDITVVVIAVDSVSIPERAGTHRAASVR
jgi:serine phosphatase RsbU (regulator of sigma subunit)